MSTPEPSKAPQSSPRVVVYAYRDPLELIWCATAKELGIRVRRSREVYASWDGESTLSLGEDEDLDPDDSLAQMILHELCHALVEGEESHVEQDWGLSNVDERDAVREFAAMRLQAALTSPYGLRRFMAVTTDWRHLYDALPQDPLAGEEEAARLARMGFVRATEGPWSSALSRALEATAILARVTGRFADSASLWSTAGHED